MNGSVCTAVKAVPALHLARLEKLLTSLKFNRDLSVNATLLAQHFGKANQEYEKVHRAYHEELCQRYGCRMGDLIKEGTRGRVPKGAEPGSNARRYCKELALHFAQWADPALAADLQEALQLLLSGQISTESSISAAASLASAAEEGRSTDACKGDSDLEGVIGGMGSLGILPPFQVLALLQENQRLSRPSKL